MNLATSDHTLRVSGLRELNATNASTFRDAVRSAITAAHKLVDLDMSETGFLDSSGLGALVSIHKAITARGGALRIIRPTPPVVQILELTRMHRIFEIVSA